VSPQSIARRYAVALFELAKEGGTLDQVAADLRDLRVAIETDPDVGRFFLSPVVDRRGKDALLRGTFAEKVSPLALNTLSLLIRKRREALLTYVVDAYWELLREDRKREPLQIASARPIAPGELERMIARLSQVYGKQFDVSTSVDPALLGGVQIKMGDRYIDGSIAGRLDELARELFANQ
jgi:F-type H+-transporting ATPase subunit delta